MRPNRISPIIFPLSHIDQETITAPTASTALATAQDVYLVQPSKLSVNISATLATGKAWAIAKLIDTPVDDAAGGLYVRTWGTAWSTIEANHLIIPAVFTWDDVSTAIAVDQNNASAKTHMIPHTPGCGSAIWDHVLFLRDYQNFTPATGKHKRLAVGFAVKSLTTADSTPNIHSTFDHFVWTNDLPAHDPTA